MRAASVHDRILALLKESQSPVTTSTILAEVGVRNLPYLRKVLKGMRRTGEVYYYQSHPSNGGRLFLYSSEPFEGERDADPFWAAIDAAIRRARRERCS